MGDWLGDLGEGFWQTGISGNVTGPTTLGVLFGVKESPQAIQARQQREAGMDPLLKEAQTQYDDATRRGWLGGFNAGGDDVRQRAQALVGIYKTFLDRGDTANAQEVRGLMDRLKGERQEAVDVIDPGVGEIDRTIQSVNAQRTADAGLDAERQRLAQSDPFAKLANPYEDGNPALQALLGRQQGSINRNFANAEEDMRRTLAQRGVLGTAQETSALRRLSLDRARTLSGAESDLRAQNYQQADNFNRWKTAASTEFRQGGERSALQRLQFGQQMNYQMGRDAVTDQRYGQQRQDQNSNNFWGNAGAAANTFGRFALEYGPQIMDWYNNRNNGGGKTVNKSPLPGGGPWMPRDETGRAY